MFETGCEVHDAFYHETWLKRIQFFDYHTFMNDLWLQNINSSFLRQKVILNLYIDLVDCDSITKKELISEVKIIVINESLSHSLKQSHYSLIS